MTPRDECERIRKWLDKRLEPRVAWTTSQIDLMVQYGQEQRRAGWRAGLEKAAGGAPELARKMYTLMYQDCTCEDMPEQDCWWHLNEGAQVANLTQEFAAAIRAVDEDPIKRNAPYS